MSVFVTNKKTFLIPILSLFVGLFASPTFADWTPPTDTPFLCSSNQPGCSVPLNASSTAQIKTGPLGISNTLTANNFYARQAGLGPSFINGVFDASSILAGTSLDLNGTLKNRYGSPATTKVFTSTTTGLASWQPTTWINDDPAFINNIYNVNSGNVGVGTTSGDTLPAKLTFNGAIGRLGDSLLGASFSTHTNLGNSPSVTGGGSGGGEPAAATILGGSTLTAEGNYSTIAGGRQNRLRHFSGSLGSVIAGGGGPTTATRNEVNNGGLAAPLSTNSVIVGGTSNLINSRFSVSSGATTTTLGDHTWVGGRFMRLNSATTDNSFAWGQAAAEFRIDTPDAFLIFPNNPSPASGRVGLGTSTPAAKLEVVGGIKTTATNPTLALEVVGPVKITGGNPGAGKALKTIIGDGTATWEDQVNSGESVMYLRSANSCGPGFPLTCAAVNTNTGSTWLTADTLQPEWSGSAVNYVTTCYQNVNTCQVLYLRQAVDPFDPGCTFPNWLTYDPPTCTAALGSGWLEADLRSERDTGGDYNRVRTCFKCN